MLIHDLTLMVSLALAAMTGAIFIGIMSTMKHTILGSRNWAIGLALLAVAYSSPILLLEVPHSVKITIFNLSLLLGHSFWLIGGWQFIGRSIAVNTKIWLVVPVVILTLALTFVWPNRELRLLLIGSWLILVRFNYALSFFKHARTAETEKVASNLIAVLAILEVVVTMLYTVNAVFGDLAFIGLQAQSILVFTWIGALIGIIFATPLLMLLSVSRFMSKLDFAAHHDQLTGLFNRRGFFFQIKPLLAIAARKKQTLSVMMLDIDYFKQVNDQHGHAVGDDVLIILSNSIRENLRVYDIAARWGGEEVCVLLQDINALNATKLANRIRVSFIENCKHIVLSDKTITVSIGVSCDTLENKNSFDQILLKADKALSDAKNDGRNCVKIRDVVDQ